MLIAVKSRKYIILFILLTGLYFSLNSIELNIIETNSERVKECYNTFLLKGDVTHDCLLLLLSYNIEDISFNYLYPEDVKYILLLHIHINNRSLDNLIVILEDKINIVHKNKHKQIAEYIDMYLLCLEYQLIASNNDLVAIESLIDKLLLKLKRENQSDINDMYNKKIDSYRLDIFKHYSN